MMLAGAHMMAANGLPVMAQNEQMLVAGCGLLKRAFLPPGRLPERGGIFRALCSGPPKWLLDKRRWIPKKFKLPEFRKREHRPEKLNKEQRYKIEQAQNVQDGLREE